MRLGVRTWYLCSFGAGVSYVFDRLMKKNTKTVFHSHLNLFFLFDSMYLLLVNAANVLNAKCTYESLNNLFLSSVFEAWKSRSLFMGMYTVAFAIFFSGQHHFVNGMKS